MVPESSATIGFPSTIEESIPLNGDHVKIVKYVSETDRNYLTVSTTIGRTIASIMMRREPKKKSEVEM